MVARCVVVISGHVNETGGQVVITWTCPNTGKAQREVCVAVPYAGLHCRVVVLDQLSSPLKSPQRLE